MEHISLGYGTAEEFVLSEFEYLNLRDKRLNRKAMAILKALQSRLTTCVRRLFIDKNEARQAYDFF